MGSSFTEGYGRRGLVADIKLVAEIRRAHLTAKRAKKGLVA